MDGGADDDNVLLVFYFPPYKVKSHVILIAFMEDLIDFLLKKTFNIFKRLTTRFLNKNTTDRITKKKIY